VKFHDGADFDCSVVKLNFDHVWAGDLKGPGWHGWYGLPGALSEWSCDGEVFVLSTSEPRRPARKSFLEPPEGKLEHGRRVPDVVAAR